MEKLFDKSMKKNQPKEAIKLEDSKIEVGKTNLNDLLAELEEDVEMSEDLDEQAKLLIPKKSSAEKANLVYEINLLKQSST